MVIEAETPRVTRDVWQKIFDASPFVIEKVVDNRELIWQDARCGVIFVLGIKRD